MVRHLIIRMDYKLGTREGACKIVVAWNVDSFLGLCHKLINFVVATNRDNTYLRQKIPRSGSLLFFTTFQRHTEIFLKRLTH